MRNVGNEVSAETYHCADCGQVVSGADYHPRLYCVLYRAGIPDQATYLAAMGWVRREEGDGDG